MDSLIYVVYTYTFVSIHGWSVQITYGLEGGSKVLCIYYMIFLFGIGKSAHRQRGCVKTSYPYPRNLMFHWGKQPETTKICGGSGAKTLRSQNGFCMILSEHVLPHSIQWETNHHFFQRTLFFLGISTQYYRHYIPSI